LLFADGLVLISFVAALAHTDTPTHYIRRPTNRVHYIENCSIALRRLAATPGLAECHGDVAAEHFVDGCFVQVAGFCWRCFSHAHRLAGLEPVTGQGDQLLLRAQELARRWDPTLRLADDCHCLQSGHAFAALARALGCAGHASGGLGTAPNESAVARAAAAITALEAECGVPPLIEPVAIANGSADRRVVRMYLSLIWAVAEGRAVPVEDVGPPAPAERLSISEAVARRKAERQRKARVVFSSDWEASESEDEGAPSLSVSNEESPHGSPRQELSLPKEADRPASPTSRQMTFMRRQVDEAHAELQQSHDAAGALRLEVHRLEGEVAALQGAAAAEGHARALQSEDHRSEAPVAAAAAARAELAVEHSVALGAMANEHGAAMEALQRELEGHRNDAAALQTILVGLNDSRAGQAARIETLERELAAAQGEAAQAKQLDAAARAVRVQLEPHRLVLARGERPTAVAESACTEWRYAELQQRCKKVLANASRKLQTFKAERTALHAAAAAAAAAGDVLRIRCEGLEARLGRAAAAGAAASSGATLRRVKAEHGERWRAMPVVEKRAALEAAGAGGGLGLACEGGALVLSGLALAGPAGGRLLEGLGMQLQRGRVSKLSLAGCRLAEVNLALLAGALRQAGSALVELDLSENGLTAGWLAQAFAGRLQEGTNATLRALRLDGSTIDTESGVEWLGGQLLPSTSGLEHLSLARCFEHRHGSAEGEPAGLDTEAAADRVFFAPVLRGLPSTLKALSLAGNDLGDWLLAEPTEPQPRATPVQLPRAGSAPSPPPVPPPASGALAIRLLALEQLELLELGDNARLGCAGARALAAELLRSHPALTELDLQRCGVGRDGLRAIGATLAQRRLVHPGVMAVELSGNALEASTAVGGSVTGRRTRALDVLMPGPGVVVDRLRLCC
jgi:hypothetical protein